VNKGLQKALDSLGQSIDVEFQCSDCGGSMVLEEGCMKCYSCGLSKC